MTLTHSDSINELATALAKAQGAMRGALKDADNPYFKSRYADLASVWEACRKPLTDNGIAVLQSPAAEGSTVRLETLLLHSSGQWVRGIATATAKDDGPQAVGSTVTYLRRYALQSFAGVAPEDDDAEAAEAAGRNGKAQATAPPKPPTGYEGWLHDLTATADNGMEALKKAWDASAPAFRNHLVTTAPKTWEELKAKSKRVPVSA